MRGCNALVMCKIVKHFAPQFVLGKPNPSFLVSSATSSALKLHVPVSFTLGLRHQAS